MQILLDKMSALDVEAQDTVEFMKMGIEVYHRSAYLINRALLAVELGNWEPTSVRSCMGNMGASVRSLQWVQRMLVLTGDDGHRMLPTVPYLCGQATRGWQDFGAVFCGGWQHTASRTALARRERRFWSPLAWCRCVWIRTFPSWSSLCSISVQPTPLRRHEKCFYQQSEGYGGSKSVWCDGSKAPTCSLAYIPLLHI